MNAPEFNEKQLLADIDQLRGQFPQTQDLYREVCILLFFRYGVTPTTNKLYQLVRKGSMSAPAEALGRFWEDLRDKSRVRIEHPDLPESLKTAAGELVAQLWSSAQAAAQEGLAELRGDAQIQVAEARQLQAVAEADRDAIRASHALVSQTLEQAHARIGELEQALAAREATIAALEGQLQNARGENTGLLQKLEEARRDFSTELEKLRAAASLAEERYRASEARALMEIDRERTAAARLQKELDATRKTAEQQAERQRVETSTLNQQLGDFRQRVGELEGNLKEVTTNRDLVSDELKTVRNLLNDKHAHATRMENEAIELRVQLDQAQRKLEDLAKVAKPVRQRKPKPV
ncbi:MAG TPA: DNA-binding protein [Noviherbaspirillum sp.]|uniref:DNA-binding protein n=1 Tax=Noviherbaspirillum sp. TaxID=1926288 RepID=UPI002B4769BA|nr:DNA-binding protein [Noviherbaspirillum sp.]HJV86861.1 DNA-binding protein [Noviherbaspirillum sp.]